MRNKTPFSAQECARTNLGNAINYLLLRFYDTLKVFYLEWPTLHLCYSSRNCAQDLSVDFYVDFFLHTFNKDDWSLRLRILLLCIIRLLYIRKLVKLLCLHEWAGMTAVIPEIPASPRRKPTWNNPCVVFLCMSEITRSPTFAIPDFPITL